MYDRRGTVDRAALYARVSGDDRNNDGRNLKGQLDDGRKYCQQRGYAVITELSEDDRGASGAAWELPQLSRILEMARLEEFEVLVVRELDRLSRNLAKQLVVEEELKRAGVRIEYVLGEYPDSPEGDLNKHIRASIAEYERAKIRERMNRGKHLKVRGGSVILGRFRIFGYCTVETEDHKRVLQINEEEAAIVRRIFRWYVYGDDSGQPLSFLAIQRKLADMRVLSLQDRRKGAETFLWPRSSLAAMIDTRAYMGEWDYQAEEGPIYVAVPAIVDPAVWERAQAQREHNRRNVRRQPKRDYLLRGMLTCRECGRIMIAQTSTHSEKSRQGKSEWGFYECRTRIQGTWARPCGMHKQFGAKKLDKLVWEWICSFLMDAEKLAAGLNELHEQREQRAQPIRERLLVIDELIRGHEAQITEAAEPFLRVSERLRALIARQVDDLELAISGLERERETLQSKLKTHEITPEQIRSVQEYAAEIRKGILEADEISFEGKRRVLFALNFRGTLAVEDGQKVLHAECELGSKALGLLSNNSSGAGSRGRGSSCT